MNTLAPKSLKSIVYALGIVLAFNITVAQSKELVAIQNAWVRPTNPGQDTGAAYMTLTSKQDVTLTHVESNITKSIEIHSMSMQNGVMKMRMLETLQLVAGKPYKLEPGGFHLMLFDLKDQLTEGKVVEFGLTFKTRNNVEYKQKIKAAVQASADNSGVSTSDKNEHEHHQH